MTAEQAWAPVLTELTDAADYWVCTVRPDGRPHAAPVWGVWWRGSLVFSSIGFSVKVGNLRANDQVTVHLSSAQQVVIADGTATEIADPAELAELGALFDAKYADGAKGTYDLAASRAAGMAICAVRAEVVRQWSAEDMFHSQRFTFNADGAPVLDEKKVAV